MQTQKITTFLWLEGNQGEEAAKYYTSILPNSKITSVSPMGAGFEAMGQTFFALNGKDAGKPFTEATSFFVDCEDQAEVDRYWAAFTANGGAESQCGWLKDKFGVSWQIIPRALMKLMGDPDREKAGRVMQAMLKMRKIDVAGLERAYAGK